MEIHLSEAEILRILLAHINSITPEEYEFNKARISNYPYKVILSVETQDEAQ